MRNTFKTLYKDLKGRFIKGLNKRSFNTII
jgi:hypothetical protein